MNFKNNILPSLAKELAEKNPEEVVEVANYSSGEIFGTIFCCRNSQEDFSFELCVWGDHVSEKEFDRAERDFLAHSLEYLGLKNWKDIPYQSGSKYSSAYLLV